MTARKTKHPPSHGGESTSTNTPLVVAAAGVVNDYYKASN